ncbi:MAG: BMP family ABC transporter substrate-binding protein [Oscillospiraceae bacterium]|nr:BMP family ABC transporter substrate-binding protein [Oscillospiraceae bacterium]MDY2847186.1 BMP family ABC transporter substrate-binding protein [Oscillospiraceae bacterium]
MNQKRMSALALCLAVSASLLSGCGGDAEPDSYDDYVVNTSPSSEGQDDGAAESNAGIPKENVNIGVLYISDPAEGSGYSYTHDLGIQGMQKNLGLSDSQIHREIVDDADAAATEQAIEKLVAEGCNIIFTTSWGYMETTAACAEKYPDVYFSHGTGYLSNGKNFTNYFGRIYQARYLSGIVAGLNTESDKIGYVAAMGTESSEVTGGIDAFALGVYSVNPDAEIYVKVTNSWYDPDLESQYAFDLLDAGCDVITQHADTAFPAINAESRGAYSIGYNSDMSKEAPDSVLCSVIWTWSAYYTEAVQSVINGTWNGENYYGGLAEGLVGITDTSDFCNPECDEKIAEATQQMLSGSFNVFDGVIETNTGDTVGEAGSTLSDSEITGGINWYFKTVTVLE